jgi:hypothetical protein
MVAFVMIGALFLRADGSGPLPFVFEIPTPPTQQPMSFSLSPDGRQLAFVAMGDGQSRLWIRPLARAHATTIPGTERAMMPFWSPDGRAIGFFADGKLKRVDVAGGVPQVIADAPEPRGGAWSRDGTILFAPFPAGHLMQVAASGGRAAATAARGRWPQFLPDGKRFLCFVGPTVPEVQGVYLGSLDGRPQTRIAPSESASIYVPPDHLLVVHEGTLLAWRFDPLRGAIAGDPLPIAEGVGSDGRLGPAFSVAGSTVMVHRGGSGQRRQFVWIDRSGKVVGTAVSADDTVLAHPELAPDGRHVAFQRYQHGFNNIWLLDLRRSVATQFTMQGAVNPYGLVTARGSSSIPVRICWSSPSRRRPPSRYSLSTTCPSRLSIWLLTGNPCCTRFILLRLDRTYGCCRSADTPNRFRS